MQRWWPAQNSGEVVCMYLLTLAFIEAAHLIIFHLTIKMQFMS